jgi:hypothetical protein
MFGYDWVPIDRLFAPAAVIPLLSIIYVLGIVSDRVADALFAVLWTRTLRGRRFNDIETYYAARRIILTESERLSELLEYGRSRLRICRGWVLNAFVILVSFNVFVWTRLREWPRARGLSIVVSALLLVLLAGCWYSWWSLSAAEYRKVKGQSEHEWPRFMSVRLTSPFSRQRCRFHKEGRCICEAGGVFEGRCGQTWKRAVLDPLDENEAHWIGACGLPPGEQMELLRKRHHDSS